MRISIREFKQLSTIELYDILALRTRIFVVEQKCAYQEVDYHDQHSIHITGYNYQQLVAYARVVAPHELYDEPSIGRVCVHPDYRGMQLGRRIFEIAVSEAESMYPGQALKIQAQVYLEDFYATQGFQTITQPYLDFGIWHVDMVK
ncbi:MAG TPA: GNAT family N-acetyltransferase [Cryomorphaceae bacterium]|nr:GNAT family N-acetyltransferase [Owenweeksia sp.]HBF22131.1 GNAT family N-acetyltransferase [Cryomorphaceae bacterium]|tara:strand:- start:1109 stop:1546 length:438 start_codon:yes stop_codon:yes gene_type:complete